MCLTRSVKHFRAWVWGSARQAAGDTGAGEVVGGEPAGAGSARDGVSWNASTTVPQKQRTATVGAGPVRSAVTIRLVPSRTRRSQVGQ